MVDEDVVVDKLRHINRYTDDLTQMRGMSKEEYVEDMVTQRAVERTLMNLIQACIDLARHIRSAEGLSPTGTAKQEIADAYYDDDITFEELKDLVGHEEAANFRLLKAQLTDEFVDEVAEELADS